MSCSLRGLLPALAAMSAVILVLAGVLEWARKPPPDRGLKGIALAVLFFFGALNIASVVGDSVCHDRKLDELLRQNEELIRQSEELLQQNKELLQRIDVLHENLNALREQRCEQLPSTPPPAAGGEVQIQWPRTGDLVGPREAITGTGPHPGDTVWVVVHPMEVGGYWIQPPAIVRGDLTWSASPYIGRAETADSGKKFEIIAVLNPEKSLSEGQTLLSWPKAQTSSNVIMVTRK